ncbi:MAG: YkgJ family cysteine cluster protein, partial [Anaerolineae bacterium]|nr:YkgJ family cysteine cluster protein [Phycisphaerae bacterium]
IAGDAERITTLNWPADDPLHGADVLLRHAGKTFLAQRADGACVFLNESNGRCRIHEQFGGDVKPLGCRLFPFQISATFAGEVSVTARYDCPTVRRNVGAPHADALPELRRFAQQTGVSSLQSFDDATRCFLDRDQVEAVCEFLGTLMGGFARDEQRAMLIALMCNQLEMMQTDQLERATLAHMYPELKRHIEATTAAPIDRPSAVHRMAFRAVLGMYLRRDEDVLDGRATRFGRTIAMTKLVLGYGGFGALGSSNQPGKLSKAKLFANHQRFEPRDENTFALHWRMIHNKLESFQFMGAANGGRNFLAGLRSLALLYPLVRAVAQYNAANRDATQIEPDDVDQAVAAIEHSFGRSVVLNQPWARSLERQLVRRDVFVRLACPV